MWKNNEIKEKCSPGRPRRVENEGLEPSRALPGAMWAQGGRQERSKWLLGAARGAKTNYWLDPGPPQRRKVDRFQGPGGVPGGLWGGSGVVFLDFFRSRGAGNQKTRKNNQNNVFSYLLSACFLYIFLCCLASWSRRRRESGP